MEIFKNTNFDFLKWKWPFIGASLVLSVAGLSSIALRGGVKYGIDFKGGAIMTVKWQGAPPIEKIRAAMGSKVRGEVVVQNMNSISDKDLVLISTELQEERLLNQNRKAMSDVLESTFGQAGGKVDFNNVGQQALVEKLRDPLQAAGAQLNDEQLGKLVGAMLEYRDTPPRSGLLGSLDQLSAVPGVNSNIINVLKQQSYLGPYHVRGVEMVGPKVGAELRAKAVAATLYALAGMLVYIAFRFEWIYGVAAVVACFHDTIITIGLFSLFGKEIDLTVIAALLTLVGYSMNDTIVIFDRIRENRKLSKGGREGLESLINRSVNQTLSRTIMTSGLTFLTVIALFLFGGPVLHGFSFALVVGIIIGTYSSVFVASPIVLFWQNYSESRRRVVAPVPTAAAPKSQASVKPQQPSRKPTKAAK
jgi:preprotein translocase subunit SecF